MVLFMTGGFDADIQENHNFHAIPLKKLSKMSLEERVSRPEYNREKWSEAWKVSKPKLVLD